MDVIVTHISKKATPYLSLKGGFAVSLPRKRIVFLLTGLVLAWLTVRFLLPLIRPFLLGLVLALAAEPMVRFLENRLRLPRQAAAVLSVSLAFGLLILVLTVLCAAVLRQLRSLAGILPDLEEAARAGLDLVQTNLLALTARAPRHLQSVLAENLHLLFSDGSALLGKATAWLLGLAGRLLSRLPDSTLGFGTGILSAFLLSARLPKIRRWLLGKIPRDTLAALENRLKRLRRMLRSWLTAQLKLMSVTYCIIAGGLTLLRIPRSLLWAFVIALVDALPVFGTGTVLIPWALVCFLQGNRVLALGIAGTYATAALTRSILEPKLLGQHLGLDPLAALAALYIGCRLWGIAGMIAAPMVTVALLQLSRAPGE